MALMAVVYAAQPKFWRMQFGRAGLGRIIFEANRALRRWFPGILESAASPALFYSQNNIDQRIGNLKTKLAQRHWRRQAIAGDRRVALSLIREAS
jgi:hypothetical protein